MSVLVLRNQVRLNVLASNFMKLLNNKENQKIKNYNLMILRRLEYDKKVKLRSTIFYELLYNAENEIKKLR